MKFVLKEQTPTATAEFDTELGVIKFEITPIVMDQMCSDYIGIERTSDRIRAALVDHIVGWNLDQEDGTPWPCDKETKEKVVPQIVGIMAKPKGAPGPFQLAVGALLFDFAADEKNYLKN